MQPGYVHRTLCWRLATPVVALLLVMSPRVYGDLVTGEVFPLRQPDGTRIDVRIWGDEFYRVVESLDGYTLVRDPETGVGCYASLSPDGSELISTGVPVEPSLPPGLDLQRHIRINSTIAREKITAARARAAEGEVEVLTTLQKSGAYPLPPCTGNVKGIVLLVDFSDEPWTIPASDVDDYCNQVGFNGYGNNGSIRDYFHDVSDGNLTYTNFVSTAYYRALHPKTYYEDPDISYGTRARELIIEALTALNNQGFDFSQYDSNGDGLVDGINCFYAGFRGSVWAEGLWPHSWTVYFTADGVSTYRYQITDLRDSLALNTFCHENGHMICYWPDLYDYDPPGPDDSAGVGKFCIMCSSTSTTNPQEPCAYMKYIAGWSTTTVLTTPQSDLLVPSGVNTLYKFEHPTQSNEYYLIENRQQSGRDSGLPDAGLAVWHVDTYGDNDYQEMTPALHYLVTLVQADGNWDLEHNLNTGDETDLWARPTYDECTPDTNPDTDWWDGSASDLFITDISSSSSVMTFSFRDSPDCNGNDISDYADIAWGSSLDENTNGVPDECECVASSDPPGEEPVQVVAKNRYISFVPANPGQQTALLVELSDLPPGLEESEGTVMWVGAPQDIAENPGTSGNTPPTFKGADLTSDPVYRDWGTLGLLHVYGEAIMPGASYEIRAINEACFAGAEANYSEALAVGTADVWGDVVDAMPGAPPNGECNFDDIAAVVDKFKDLPGAPVKARVDMSPDLPDRIVNFADISDVVDAFRGLPYPYDGPPTGGL